MDFRSVPFKQRWSTLIGRSFVNLSEEMAQDLNELREQLRDLQQRDEEATRTAREAAAIAAEMIRTIDEIT